MSTDSAVYLNATLAFVMLGVTARMSPPSVLCLRLRGRGRCYDDGDRLWRPQQHPNLCSHPLLRGVAL